MVAIKITIHVINYFIFTTCKCINTLWIVTLQNINILQFVDTYDLIWYIENQTDEYNDDAAVFVEIIKKYDEIKKLIAKKLTKLFTKYKY